jgi:hypothetical protein
MALSCIRMRRYRTLDEQPYTYGVRIDPPKSPHQNRNDPGRPAPKRLQLLATAKYFVFNVRAENMLESSGYCWLVVTHEWWEDTFHAAPVPNV